MIIGYFYFFPWEQSVYFIIHLRNGLFSFMYLLFKLFTDFCYESSSKYKNSKVFLPFFACIFIQWIAFFSSVEFFISIQLHFSTISIACCAICNLFRKSLPMPVSWSGLQRCSFSSFRVPCLTWRYRIHFELMHAQAEG